MLKLDYQKMGIDPAKVIEENNSQVQEIVNYFRSLARIHQRLGNTQKADRCLLLANHWSLD